MRKIYLALTIAMTATSSIAQSTYSPYPSATNTYPSYGSPSTMQQQDSQPSSDYSRFYGSQYNNRNQQNTNQYQAPAYTPRYNQPLTNDNSYMGARPEGYHTFHGYRCTQNCSGHEAGYDWARRNHVDDNQSCSSGSKSFREGCKAYSREH